MDGKCSINLSDIMLTPDSCISFLASLHPRCGANSRIRGLLTTEILRWIVSAFDGEFEAEDADGEVPLDGAIVIVTVKHGIAIRFREAFDPHVRIETTLTTSDVAETVREVYPSSLALIETVSNSRGVYPFNVIGCLAVTEKEYQRAAIDPYYELNVGGPHPSWYREILYVNNVRWSWCFDMAMKSPNHVMHALVIMVTTRFSPFDGTTLTISMRRRYRIYHNSDANSNVRRYEHGYEGGFIKRPIEVTGYEVMTPDMTPILRITDDQYHPILALMKTLRLPTNIQNTLVSRIVRTTLRLGLGM